jgi:hypothetical protein
VNCSCCRSTGVPLFANVGLPEPLYAYNRNAHATDMGNFLNFLNHLIMKKFQKNIKILLAFLAFTLSFYCLDAQTIFDPSLPGEEECMTTVLPPLSPPFPPTLCEQFGSLNFEKIGAGTILRKALKWVQTLK